MLKTSCKKCIFAEYENNIQTGCFANRLDKFTDKNFVTDNDDKSHYLINRFCNLCHQENWAYYLKEKHKFDFTKEALLNFAKLEAMPSIDCLIILDNLTIEQATAIVDDIFSSMNDKITIWFYQTKDKFTFEQISNIYYELGIDYPEPYYLHTGRINDLYGKINNFICFIKQTNYNLPNITENLNDKINNKMEQCLFIQDEPWTLIHSNLFKMIPAKFTTTQDGVPVNTYERDKLIIEEKDFTKFNEYVNTYISLHSNHT